MQGRICPHCFTRWYSSDSSRAWECENCGHDIPVPKNDIKGGQLKMKELKSKVSKLAEEELKNSMIKFPLFNSTHEGYAVLLEEIEEQQEESRLVECYSKILWGEVKRNANKFDLAETLEVIKERATLAASEAIQVAAMAQKFIESIKEKQ